MGSTEKFCLRWKDFQSNVSGSFKELRQDEELFDVTLVCERGSVRAHRVILSACSPLFRRIIRQSLAASPGHPGPLLYLRGVDARDMEYILDFMYHGEVNVAQDDLNRFLAAAEELHVKGLTTDNVDSSGGFQSSSAAAPKPPPSSSRPSSGAAAPPPASSAARRRPAPPSVSPSAAKKKRNDEVYDGGDHDVAVLEDEEVVEERVKAEAVVVQQGSEGDVGDYDNNYDDSYGYGEDDDGADVGDLLQDEDGGGGEGGDVGVDLPGTAQQGGPAAGVVKKYAVEMWDGKGWCDICKKEYSTLQAPGRQGTRED